MGGGVNFCDLYVSYYLDCLFGYLNNLAGHLDN